VDRVTDEIAIGRITRDLEWTVSQIVGKAGVRDIQGLTGGVGGIGLRQLAIGPFLRGIERIEAVGIALRHPPPREREVAAGFPVIIDDVLRQ